MKAGDASGGVSGAVAVASGSGSCGVLFCQKKKQGVLFKEDNVFCPTKTVCSVHSRQCVLSKEDNVSCPKGAGGDIFAEFGSYRAHNRSI